MNQTENLLYQTASPINIDKLEKQNKILYEHLAAGKSITLLSAWLLYGIRHLHSRISDLRNKNNIDIYGKMITVIDAQGNKIKCKEYILEKFKK